MGGARRYMHAGASGRGHAACRTFIVRIGLRNVRIPSGLPGSGKRIGRMRPAAIISSTRLIVDVRPAPSDELLLESDRPSIPEPTCIEGEAREV